MITLKNHMFSLTINPLGAEWTSWKNNWTNQEYLFQKNPDSWMRQAPLLFPIVGRLLDNRYQYRDQFYDLSQHGFLRDMTFEVLLTSPHLAVLEASFDEETLKKYPFKFKVIVSYHLINNQVRTTLEVFNLDEKDMYFNIGGHPAFNLTPNRKNRLKFKGKNLGRFLLNGPYIEDYQTVSKKRFMVDEIDLPSTLIIDNAKSVKLKSKYYNLSLTMKPKQAIGIWAPVNQKSQKVESMIAIEPWWGMADCQDHNQNLEDKKAVMQLAPGQSKIFEFTFKIKPKL